VERVAQRGLDRMPERVRHRALSAIVALANEPRPPGCKKLKGYQRRYRVRVGDYRVVYDVFDAELVVIVIDAGHRGSVY
jgi:mRNA interferase RelE/StbE